MHVQMLPAHGTSSHHHLVQGIFMPTLALLERLSKVPHGASCLAAPEIVSRMEGVARLLGHKLNSAKIYLAKLESQKGSDVSARQATRALVAVSNQLAALGRVLRTIGASDVDEVLGGAERRTSLEIPVVRGKNTIVRSVLAELTNAR